MQYMEYMFKYDTVHGRYKGTVEHDEKHLIIDGKMISIDSQVSCIPAVCP